MNLIYIWYLFMSYYSKHTLWTIHCPKICKNIYTHISGRYYWAMDSSWIVCIESWTLQSMCVCFWDLPSFFFFFFSALRKWHFTGSTGEQLIYMPWALSSQVPSVAMAALAWVTCHSPSLPAPQRHKDSHTNILPFCCNGLALTPTVLIAPLSKVLKTSKNSIAVDCMLESTYVHVE